MTRGFAQPAGDTRDRDADQDLLSLRARRRLLRQIIILIIALGAAQVLNQVVQRSLQPGATIGSATHGGDQAGIEVQP